MKQHENNVHSIALLDVLTVNDSPFCLLCLRCLASVEQWQNFISCLLSHCFHAADIVAPVVTSSSPEGFMMDDNEGIYFMFR